MFRLTGWFPFHVFGLLRYDTSCVQVQYFYPNHACSVMKRADYIYWCYLSDYGILLKLFEGGMSTFRTLLQVVNELID